MAKVKKKALQPGVARIADMPDELRQSTYISALAISGDGRYIVTGDEKGAVHLFDTTTGDCSQRKPPVRGRRQRSIRRVAVSGDGTMIAVLYDQSAWVLGTASFDTTPGTMIRLPAYNGMILSPDGRVVAGSHVWGVTLADTATGVTRTYGPEGRAAAYGIDFVTDGTAIAAAFHDHQGPVRLRLLDVATGGIRAEAELDERDDLTGAALAARPDGSVVVVTRALELLEWDGRSAAVARSALKIPDADPDTPEPRLLAPLDALAINLRRDTVALVDLDSGEIRRELPGASRHLAAARDGQVLASSYGVLVDLYEGPALRLRTPGAGLSTFVNAVAFEPDGGALWTADRISAKRWTLPGGAPGGVVWTGGVAVRLTPGATTALVSDTHRSWVVSLPSGERLGGSAGPLHRIPGLAPDGRLVVSAGEHALGVRIWDMISGRPARDLPENVHQHPYATVFSPSGRLVVSGGGDRMIYAWEAVTGTVVARFAAPGKPPLGLDLSADESMLAIGGDERTVRILSFPEGRLLHALEGHTRRAVWALAFSPDGALLASSDARDTRLWDTTSGTLAGVARVGANVLAFSPDGRLLGAGGDGAAWVIDVDRLVGGR